MQELTHYINGEHVKGTSGRFADVYNPATGDVQAKVPLASAAELAHAVDVAATVQPAWAAVNPQRRARVMMKFVDLLNRDMDKLAEALSREHARLARRNLEFVLQSKPNLISKVPGLALVAT